MRVDPDKIEKRSNNRRYILYPAPAACCWNPLGGICITENRYPSNRRPFIGDSAALNRSLDSTKINSYSNIKEESEMSLEKSQDLKAESIFDWDVREEISFVVLKREKEAEHTYYESHKQEYKE